MRFLFEGYIIRAFPHVKQRSNDALNFLKGASRHTSGISAWPLKCSFWALSGYYNLDRLAEDSEGRTFELRANAEQSLFNSTELRAIDIEMHSAYKHATPQAKPNRRSGRQHAGSRAGDAHAVPAKPNKYILPTEVEAVILASLW